MPKKKSKREKKALIWFGTVYGINKPYNVIVDPEFLQLSLDHKLHIRESIPELLHAKGQCSLMTTKCCANFLRQPSNKKKFSIAATMIKNYTTVNCGHEGQTLSPQDCIKSIIEKHLESETKYIVAASDKTYLTVRSVPGFPIITIHVVKYSGKVDMKLLPISSVTRKYARKRADQLAQPTKAEAKWLASQKNKTNSSTAPIKINKVSIANNNNNKKRKREENKENKIETSLSSTPTTTTPTTTTPTSTTTSTISSQSKNNSELQNSHKAEELRLKKQKKRKLKRLQKNQSKINELKKVSSSKILDQQQQLTKRYGKNAGLYDSTKKMLPGKKELRKAAIFRRKQKRKIAKLKNKEKAVRNQNPSGATTNRKRKREQSNNSTSSSSSLSSQKKKRARKRKHSSKGNGDGGT